MTVFCSLHITVKPDLAIVNVRTGTCSPLNNKDFLYVNLQETQTGKDNTPICHIKVNIWMIYDNGESFHLPVVYLCFKYCLTGKEGGDDWLILIFCESCNNHSFIVCTSLICTGEKYIIKMISNKFSCLPYCIENIVIYCKFCICTHPVNSKFTIWQCPQHLS